MLNIALPNNKGYYITCVQSCIHIDLMNMKVKRHCSVLFINMCSTVGSFPLIYNNKKAILKLDRKVIDLAAWNITYTSGHTRLSPPIELQQATRRMCARAHVQVYGQQVAQPPTTTHSIGLSNKSGIMGIRLASKVMSALFALSLLCGTKAIFWQCTHAKSDSLAPESPVPGGKCAELRVLH